VLWKERGAQRTLPTELATWRSLYGWWLVSFLFHPID